MGTRQEGMVPLWHNRTTYNVRIHTQKWMVHLRNYKKLSIAQAWDKGIMVTPVP